MGDAAGLGLFVGDLDPGECGFGLPPGLLLGLAAALARPRNEPDTSTPLGRGDDVDGAAAAPSGTADGGGGGPPSSVTRSAFSTADEQSTPRRFAIARSSPTDLVSSSDRVSGAAELRDPPLLRPTTAGAPSRPARRGRRALPSCPGGGAGPT